MSPFDLKAALLAPHAQHPVLIHFPIALLLSSVAFDWLALWRKSHALAAAARINLIGAACGVPPAVATGLAAWQWQLEGAHLRGTLRLHLVLALCSALMIGVLCWLRSRRPAGGGPLSLAGDRAYLGLGLCAAALVALTAHLGGFLSGVNGAIHP